MGKPKKHASYTAKFKIQVATFAKENNILKASQKFDIDRKRVREWVRELDSGKLAALPPSTKRKPGGGRKVKNINVDRELFEWLSEKRSEGVRITGKALLTEAKHRFVEAGVLTFKASRGWLQKWMKRHSVSTREKTTVAQRMPDHVEDKIVSFHRFVIRMRRLREYPLSHIGNMDETAVYFDMPGNSTLHHKGDKTVIIRTTGHEKEKVTVILAAMADGRKLPPVVVLKGKREPAAADIPRGVLVKMSNNGWVNEEIIKWWLLHVWRRDDNRKLLVWDAFRAHRTEDVKAITSRRGDFGTNSDMAVIPGGCTGILQPADVSWNKPFKATIQDKWDTWMTSGAHTFTPAGRMRKPENKVLLCWVKEAWESLASEIIVRSFKKTGISNMLDGTEDDDLWQPSDSDEDDDELEFPGFNRNDIDETTAFRDNVRYDSEHEQSDDSYVTDNGEQEQSDDSYATDNE